VALARRNAPAAAKEFIRSRGAEVHEVDFGGGEDLSARFMGCDVWFHLIGSIQRSRSDSFEHRHRELTAQLVAHAKRAKLGRVIFLSALGTSANATNAYHRTKWEAEREVVGWGVPGALVRPGLICGRVVGPRVSKLIQKYVGMIRNKGKAVVLGGGRALVQPLDVRDLVECMIRAAERENKDMAVCELGGPEQVAFQEFVRRLAKAMGREVKIAHFPVWLAALVARLLELVQDQPALTREQVALSQVDNVCALDSVERQFGFRPRSLEESLATYAENVP
jgi:NADH dehydrogenase